MDGEGRRRPGQQVSHAAQPPASPFRPPAATRRNHPAGASTRPTAPGRRPGTPVPHGTIRGLPVAPAGRGLLAPSKRRAGVLVPPARRADTARPARSDRARAAAWQAALLAAYLAAGVALTWPRVTYLAGRLPALRDAGGYVWDFWWMARQVTSAGNPWFTARMAAPAGAWLGYHTLMPLPGLLLTPVTLAFGPSASYNLLSVACPGLLCYAMYRAARLWLPDVGAIAAGGFFGLSPVLAWRSWYEVNLAAGAIYLPLALAVCVRLRRDPRPRRAVALGLVLGGVMLTDQESAVMTAMLAAVALTGWVASPLLAAIRHSWRPEPASSPQPAGRPERERPGRDMPEHAGGTEPGWARALLLARGPAGRLAAAGLAAVVALVVAAPQLAAMAAERATGGTGRLTQVVARDYTGSGAALQQLFSFSPRVLSYGLGWLARPYYQGGPANLVVVAYGAVMSLLAIIGLIAARRRPAAWRLGLLWLACTVLALGTAPWLVHRRYLPFAERLHGVRVSALMPYTWLIQLPGLADFREANRFTELGLVGAALLAGAGTAWLAARARPALVLAVALGLLEAGWSGGPARGYDRIGVMPTSRPALTRPIAADHSGSVVVDVPFGIRGGLPVVGKAFPPEAMVLATALDHPLANAFISRVPARTRARFTAIPFYADLLEVQGWPCPATPDETAAAARSAKRLHIGWVVDWERGNAAVSSFLTGAGFRPAYRADDAAVYRWHGARDAALRRPGGGQAPEATGPHGALPPGPPCYRGPG